MKTILHVIDTTGPGGAETVFIDLITHLPADKYRSIVLIRGKGWVYEELRRRGVEPLILDAKGSFNWRYLRSLLSLIVRERVDVIQSHLLGSNVYCSLAGLLARVPVVATFHGAVDVASRERFQRLKFGLINRGSRAIVAVSESLRANISERTPLRADKTVVIYNGIDTDAFVGRKSQRLRQQFGWTEQALIVGSLGNIRPAKAYDVLLQAAALLREEVPGRDIRFVIAGQGKGGLFERLQMQRRELDLEQQVHFLGFNDDPAEFLGNLDIFLLSSSSEGFSIATVQAMAAGLPVIATRSGGPEEIVTHEENALLVDVDSPQQIAEAIARLSRDSALAQRLAAAGREHATSSFDIAAMSRAYRDLYDRI